MNQELKSGPDNQGIGDNQISKPDTGDTTTTLRCVECGKPFTRPTPEKAFRSVAAHALRSHSMKLNREDYGLGEKGEPSGGVEYVPEVDEARDYRVKTKREKAARDFYRAKQDKERQIIDYVREHPQILDELGVRRGDLYGGGRRYDTFDEIGKLGAYERIGDYYDSKKRALENPPTGYGGRDPESQREIEDIRRQLQERDSLIDRYEERERLRDVVESSIEKVVGPLKQELQDMRLKQTDALNQGITAFENVAKTYLGILSGRFELERPPKRERGTPSGVYSMIPEALREHNPIEDQKDFTLLETRRREQ